MLEVVERVVHLAVVLVHLHDEASELERADFVGLDNLGVGKHCPNVPVEFITILNEKIIRSCVFYTQKV